MQTRTTIGRLLFGVVLGMAVAVQATFAAPKGVFFSIDEGRAHLLGSIHVAKPELYPLAPAIQRAFDNAGVLVLEVRTGLQAPGEQQAKLLKAARYPPGESLKQNLSPETRQLFDQHADKAGPMANMLNQFKPWFVSVALSMPALQQLGYSPFHGIDRYFEHRAGDKRIVTLETLEEQLALFEAMDAEIQDLMLRETLLQMDELGRFMDEAFRAWKAGDVAALEAVMLDTIKKEEYQPLYDRVFLQRNREMAREIDALIREGSEPFVVVGAGHLVGPGNILEQLREEGYSVRQVK